MWVVPDEFGVPAHCFVAPLAESQRTWWPPCGPRWKDPLPVPTLKQRTLLAAAGATVAVLAVGAPASTAALEREQEKAPRAPSEAARVAAYAQDSVARLDEPTLADF